MTRIEAKHQFVQSDKLMQNLERVIDATTIDSISLLGLSLGLLVADTFDTAWDYGAQAAREHCEEKAQVELDPTLRSEPSEN